MAYVIILSFLWKVNNIILTYYSVKINRFCSKIGWFLMILAKVYEKIFSKYKILVSQAQELCFFYSSSPLNLPLRYLPNCTIPVAKGTKFSSFWWLLRHPLCAQLVLARQKFTPNVEDGSTPLLFGWFVIKDMSEVIPPQKKEYHVKDIVLLCDFQILFVLNPVHAVINMLTV